MTLRQIPLNIVILVSCYEPASQTPWGVTQRADGRLAMVVEQVDGLIDEFALVLLTRPGVTPAQLVHHFVFGWLAHFWVHVVGNTLFEATGPLQPVYPPRPGNILFESYRRASSDGNEA